MKHFHRVIMVVGTSFFLSAVTMLSAHAEPVPQGLVIQQIQVTGDEFVVLSNGSDGPIQLGSYWLQYFNDYDFTASGVSSSSYQLPAVTLAPKETVILVNGTALNCGHAWVSKTSLSLKDSAGMLQLIEINQSETGAINYVPGDYVTWSSKTNGFSSGHTPLITGVSSGAKPVWYKDAVTNSWIGGELKQGCELKVTTAPAEETNSAPIILGQSTVSPPARIVSVMGDTVKTTSGPSMPTGNVGLLAPQISEMLPNPAPPAKDDEAEYIEFYNPNDKAFDMTGFKLEITTSTKRSYTFKSAELLLEPKSFKAILLKSTNLSLSNSGAEVRLLDPFDAVIATADAYADAKDGMAWALAEGNWYWTSRPTPNEANIIEAAAPKSRSGASNGTKSVGGVQTATAAVGGGQSTGNTVPASEEVTVVSPLHPGVLAAVAGLALLYGAYEYRQDVANRFYQFRRNRELRREARPKS